MSISKYGYDTKLSAECLAYAEKFLGETNEIRKQRLAEIHHWLDDNPNINAHRDDQWILHFLRGTKFNVEEAKAKMIKYYVMRATRHEWYNDRDPFSSELADILDVGTFLPLRVKDDQNRQIFIIRTGSHDTKKHSQVNVIKVGKMILELLVAEDESITVYGFQTLFDMTGFSLAHAKQMPPSLTQKCTESSECYPTLNEKLEFINAPFYVNAIVNTIRIFMSEPQKSRISITSKLMTSVDPKILPPELGGTGDSYADLTKYWKNYLQQRAGWFVEDGKYKSKIPN